MNMRGDIESHGDVTNRNIITYNIIQSEKDMFMSYDPRRNIPQGLRRKNVRRKSKIEKQTTSTTYLQHALKYWYQFSFHHCNATSEDDIPFMILWRVVSHRYPREETLYLINIFTLIPPIKNPSNFMQRTC